MRYSNPLNVASVGSLEANDIPSGSLVSIGGSAMARRKSSRMLIVTANPCSMLSSGAEARLASEAADWLVQRSGEVGGVLDKSTVAPLLAGGGILGRTGLS